MEFNMEPYGKPGERLIIEEPDLKRTVALQNALFRYCLTSEQKAQFKSLAKEDQDTFYQTVILDNMGTAMVLNVMSYIADAPYIKRKNDLDLDAFYDYMPKKAYDELVKVLTSNFQMTSVC